MDAIKKKYRLIILLLFLDVSILMYSNIIKEEAINHSKTNYEQEYHKVTELSSSNEVLNDELDEAKSEIESSY